MDVDDRTVRGSAVAGVGAVGVSFAAILSALATAPWFSWAANALSDLGASNPPESLLFNGGLVLAGLLGLGFAPALGRSADNGFHRVALAPFVAAMAGLVGVGLFVAGTPLHFPSALVAYLGFTATLAAYGLGDWLDGARARGAVTVALAVAHVGFWSLWGAVLSRSLLPGLAIPETVGAALFSAWVAATARRVHSNA